MHVTVRSGWIWFKVGPPDLLLHWSQNCLKLINKVNNVSKLNTEIKYISKQMTNEWSKMCVNKMIKVNKK